MKQTLLHNKFLLLAAAIGLATVPTEAFAHQVQTNYFLNGQSDNLELQTTFSNGQPLKGAKVKVYSPDRPLQAQATGTTDNQGRFTFNPDETVTGEWEIQIRKAGHADILRVPVTEEGIEAELMAQEATQDIHYASSPWAVAGSMAIAAACLGFARVRSKRSA